MVPIAVVGMGCRFPAATSYAAFWELVRNGREALRDVPAGRYSDLVGNPNEVRCGDERLISLRGGFLEDIDRFDPYVFNISPREARVIDPQQRLLLEVTWEALEDAGQDFRRLAGSAAGVFVGIWSGDFESRLFRSSPSIDISMVTGGGRYAAAGRLSYVFDFQGPSMTIDTACSSSLVAIHMACQSLRAGECTMAVAGGANVILQSPVTLGYLAAGALSPDGRCKFGDAAANGYVRSEGAGVVVLKPLSAALADGDRIHAIIRGSAVTHSGRTGDSLLAPGEQGQIRLLQQALAAAEISATDLDYIEAHGTGTKVGDRMELRALGAILHESHRRSSRPCLVGSVKTNIGHTESAAGIAGLIKTILCLKHRQVPPSLHFHQPNPEIPWDQIPLKIATELTQLDPRGNAAIAGINSFGITGTFAHVIVQESPDSGSFGSPAQASQLPTRRTSACEVPETGTTAVVLPIAARSELALRELANAYAQQVRSNPAQLHDVAYSAAARRTHHEYRAAVCGSESDVIAESLEQFSSGRVSPSVVFNQAPAEVRPCVGLVFSGQGPQWAGMGIRLMAAEPVFRAVLEDLESRIKAETGWSLLDELSSPPSTSRLDVTAIAQPAIFAIQLALAALLESWGVRPAMVVGHSVGEAAAAYIAGILSLDDAVHVICHRARVLEAASGLGRMAAVELTESEAIEFLSEYAGRLGIAAINGPRSLTISGETGPLRELCTRLDNRGRFARELDVNYPFHSALLDSLLPEMEAAAHGIHPQDASIPIYSTVRGELASAGDYGAAYWPRNVREPVHFASAIEKMSAAGCNIFIEIGPHPALTYSIKQVLQATGHSAAVVSTLKRNGDEPSDLQQTLGELYVSGLDPDWATVFGPGKFVAGPSYPWQRESFWFDESASRPESVSRSSPDGTRASPLLQRHFCAMTGDRTRYWETELDQDHFGWLMDHRVEGRVVFPAAASVLMALAASNEIIQNATLGNVVFHEALFVRPGEPHTVQLALRSDDAGSSTFSIAGRGATRASNGEARTYVTGNLSCAEASTAVRVLVPHDFSENGKPPISGAVLYGMMRQRHLDYGPAFQGIEAVRFGHGECIAQLKMPEAVSQQLAAYGLHPATLDACLQVLITLTPDWSQSNDLWMPQALKSVVLRSRPSPQESLWAWAKMSPMPDGTARSAIGDVFLVNEHGNIIFAAYGVSLRRVTVRADLDRWMHAVHWHDRPLKPRTDAETRASLPRLEQLTAAMKQVHVAPELESRIRATMKELDDCSTRCVVRAFRELSFKFEPGAVFSTNEIASAIHLASQHRRLLPRLLKMLSQDGILSEEQGVWRVTSLAGTTNTPDLERRLSLASERADEFAPLWKTLARAGLNLAAVLSGKLDAVELLFGAEFAGQLEQLYAHAPFWQSALAKLTQAVAEIVRNVPLDRPLRILELGAGTGGLTTHLLPLLPADSTHYVFTDLSNYFLNRARDRFSKFQFVSYELLDIEQDPSAQGFQPHSFDLVIAANCLHATLDLRQTLQHIRGLLAPQGYLLLQEECGSQRWTDLVFGLTEGWWRFQDYDLRPDHPLLSPAAWRNLLLTQGFAEANTVDGEASDVYPCAVVLGREPGSQDRASKPSVASTPGKWLFLPDSNGMCQLVASKLQRLGQMVHIAALPNDAADRTQYTDVLTRFVESDQQPVRGIVDFRPLDAVLAETDSAADLARIEHIALGGLIGIVHALSDLDLAVSPLVLVTQNSQATEFGNEPLALVQAALWTTARVAALEQPQLRILRVDLDATVEQDASATVLTQELLANDGEDEVAFRGSTRLVPRLQQLKSIADGRIELPEDRPFRLAIRQRGSLDQIEAQEIEVPTLGPSDVQISVRAAGVNFRDVLNALGAVDPVPPGLECSGIVTAVGSEVTSVTPGQDVIAVGFGSFATDFITPAALVAPKPEQLRHEIAAALPIAYLTASYALRHVAQIGRGDCVLIHSAAGGVGLAAVQIALAAGAEVLGTAGSFRKQDYLRSLGIEQVFDSRSVEFAEQILALRGRTVNVAINCFDGDFIPKTLSVLADGGCFVEIGKRGIWSNERMAAERPDVRYQALELAQEMRTDPSHLQPMLQHVAAELAAGRLSALPTRAFPMSQVSAALRFMQHARHLGKLVLTPPASSSSSDASSRFTTGTWLITGGLGGLGMSLAHWLAKQGAKHLVLMGRSAPSETTRGAIATLRSSGVEVLVTQCDVADEAQVSALLQRIQSTMPKLRGVFHLAGVLDDGMIQQLDPGRFATVFAPKVLGAWNLHRLTRDLQLDSFVLFSSWTALVGSPGQANHSSANAFLDALAWHRRAQGLPALSINWGAWNDVGSAAKPERLAHLDRRGVGNFSAAEGLEALKRVLATDAVQIGVSPFDAVRWRAAGAPAGALRSMELLGADLAPAPDESKKAEPWQPLRALLEHSLPGTARRKLIEERVEARLSHVLRLPGTRFSVRKPFKELGLDSLTSLEFRNYLEQDTDLKLPASLVYNYATIGALAAELARRMELSVEASHSTPTSDGPATDDDEMSLLLQALGQLPDGEAEKLLSRHEAAGEER